MRDPVLTRRAAIAAVLMAAAAAAGQAMVPTRRMADMRGHFELASLVPQQFADWQIDQTAVAGIVNPEAETLIDKIYSQTLDRVYVDASGHRVMLSIAYGRDQADDSVQLHYPEICYPAQGFKINGNQVGRLDIPEGAINVRRLQTQFSDSRFEPVTYWTIVGDEQSLGGWDRKLSEIRHGIHGEIVDGLLFRVSSIDRNAEQGFRVQNGFIRDLVHALTPPARKQLVGLS